MFFARTSRIVTVAIVASLFLAPLLPAVAFGATISCAGWTRNLRQGMSGGDVRSLQIMLNKSAITRIALSGPGSSGNETSYFGPATKAAVIRFQNSYKKEVLTPAGLTVGSGFVGSLTRAKLGVLCRALSGTKSVVTVKPTVATVPAATVATLPAQGQVNTGSFYSVLNPVQSATPVVLYPEKYVVNPGETIRVIGSGFTSSGNIVHLGKAYAVQNTTYDALRGAVTFTLPLGVPLGKYALSVSNERGQSPFASVLVVRAKGTVDPSISSIWPPAAPLGSRITLTGSGFAATGNDVFFAERKFADIPSIDGRTLQFTIDSGLLSKATSTPPLDLYLINANGISNFVKFRVGR